MSEIGLFSSIYDQIRNYAVILDDVLIHLKEGTSSSEDPRRQELGRLLINLAGPTYDDPSNRLSVLMLNGFVRLSSAELTKTGDMLLSR